MKTSGSVQFYMAVSVGASSQNEDSAGSSSLLPPPFLERAGALHLLGAPGQKEPSLIPGPHVTVHEKILSISVCGNFPMVSHPRVRGYQFNK